MLIASPVLENRRRGSRIARRTLLQSITVRLVLEEQGAETGIFEIPVGGRRNRALELLVKQKRVGARQSTIARLESGQTLPSTKTLLRFVETTGSRFHVRLSAA